MSSCSFLARPHPSTVPPSNFPMPLVHNLPPHKMEESESHSIAEMRMSKLHCPPISYPKGSCLRSSNPSHADHSPKHGSGAYTVYAGISIFTGPASPEWHLHRNGGWL